MKKLLILNLILVSCVTMQNKSLLHDTAYKNQTNNNDQNNQLKNTDQIFISISNKEEKSGKCYAKSKKGEELRWTEVLCESQITKQIIGQIQKDLVRLGYHIDENEIESKKFNTTSKTALKKFQEDENMFTGQIDWATINSLRLK